MIEIIDLDFNNKDHTNALVELMNHYMTDKMGNYKPHDTESAERLIEGLKNHPSKLCLLAKQDSKFIGLCNCFINFGTFAAKPFINIHDIVIKDSTRGLGVGRKLMNAIIDRAKILDCAKVTLEVRNDNVVAQNLYNSLGFKDGQPPMFFWSKYL